MNSASDGVIELTDEHFIPVSSGPLLYRRKDYVGALRHSVIFAVDGFIIYLICSILFALHKAVIDSLQVESPQEFDVLGGLGCILACWVYLAVLKPSPFRSVGYWIADARIVTIYGRPPSPWRMTLRLIWSALSLNSYYPVSIVTDLLWTTIEDERQMLRDLVTETRLIRNNAKPIGVGKISRCLFTGLGIIVSYARVREKNA
jgi:uncharacterized RDD family membrane protein YckC